MDKYFIQKTLTMDQSYNWGVYERGKERALALCRTKKDANIVCGALNAQKQNSEKEIRGTDV